MQGPRAMLPPPIQTASPSAAVGPRPLLPQNVHVNDLQVCASRITLIAQSCTSVLKQLYEKQQSLTQLHADLLTNPNSIPNPTPGASGPLDAQQVELILQQLRQSIAMMEARYNTLRAQSVRQRVRSA